MKIKIYIIVILIIVVCVMLILLPSQRDNFLVKYNKIYSKDEILHISHQTNVVMRDFDNGDWVGLIYEHDCCAGKGFVANIFIDSNKSKRIDINHNFCNIKSTEAEIYNISANNLKDFYNKLDKILSEK